MTAEDWLELAAMVESSIGKLDQDGQTIAVVFNAHGLVKVLRARAETAITGFPPLQMPNPA